MVVANGLEGPAYDYAGRPFYSQEGHHMAYAARRGKAWVLVEDRKERALAAMKEDYNLDGFTPEAAPDPVHRWTPAFGVCKCPTRKLDIQARARLWVCCSRRQGESRIPEQAFGIDRQGAHARDGRERAKSTAGGLFRVHSQNSWGVNSSRHEGLSTCGRRRAAGQQRHDRSARWSRRSAAGGHPLRADFQPGGRTLLCWIRERQACADGRNQEGP